MSFTLSEGSYSADDLATLGAKEKDISAISIYWGTPRSPPQGGDPEAHMDGINPGVGAATFDGSEAAAIAAAAAYVDAGAGMQPPHVDQYQQHAAYGAGGGNPRHRTAAGQAAPGFVPSQPRPPPRKWAPPPRRLVEDTNRPTWAMKVAAERWQEIPDWARKHLTEERCAPMAKANCDDQELAFIEKTSGDICGARACSRDDESRFEDEAKRLAAKRMDVKPAARAWIERRVALLHGIACRLKEERSEL